MRAKSVKFDQDLPSLDSRAAAMNGKFPPPVWTKQSIEREEPETGRAGYWENAEAGSDQLML